MRKHYLVIGNERYIRRVEIPKSTYDLGMRGVGFEGRRILTKTGSISITFSNITFLELEYEDIQEEK